MDPTVVVQRCLDLNSTFWSIKGITSSSRQADECKTNFTKHIAVNPCALYLGHFTMFFGAYPLKCHNKCNFRVQIQIPMLCVEYGLINKNALYFKTMDLLLPPGPLGEARSDLTLLPGIKVMQWKVLGKNWNLLFKKEYTIIRNIENSSTICRPHKMVYNMLSIQVLRLRHLKRLLVVSEHSGKKSHSEEILTK